MESVMSYCPSPALRSRSVTPMSPKLCDLMPSIADHTISNHLTRSCGGGGMGHAKTVYNPARNALYSRYTTNDWETSNKTNFSLSEREKSLAERLRSDAYRAIKSTDSRTRNRQQSNTKRLADRRDDINQLKIDLNTEIGLMERETADLAEHRRVLEKAYFDTKSPLAIAEECLLQREKRQGIDQVHDDVERSLSKEVEIIKKCQDKMKKFLERAAIQLKMNRAAQNACERDSKDKNHAENLDDRMHQLRNSSSGLGFYPGIESVDNTITIPYSWMKYTQENINRSQKEREASEKLRGEIDALLRWCANAMWSQFNSVNNSFNMRLNQANDAKNKLQQHLLSTNNGIAQMEKTAALIRKAICDKEGPMKLAQTRLEERTRRINVELCNDPVMQGLQKEVQEIRESVRVLKEKLRQAEDALVRLRKTRSALQHDINVKENSLMIDSKYCMGMRKSMAMDPKVGPLGSVPAY